MKTICNSHTIITIFIQIHHINTAKNKLLMGIVPPKCLVSVQSIVVC